MIMRSALAIGFVIFLAMAVAWGSDHRQDGNWWRKQNDSFKVGVIIGFARGEEVGQLNAARTFRLAHGDDRCVSAVTDHVLKAKGTFSNTTVGQIIDGVETFYADYRNRTIWFHSAIQFVLDGIKGTPRDELDRMIEDARKRSSK
jgi:hypothetical protein